MKSKEAFSLWNLLPNFRDFFDGNLHSSDWLSTLFILGLILAFAVAMFYALGKFFSSLNQVKFYDRLLGDIDQKQLSSRQRDLTIRALSYKNADYGKLWREFDETLVYSPDGSKLSNTLEAAHFFNTGSLSKGLTGNRLLAAVPGFLTAIGVIGTFVGLTMGLATLEVNQDAGVDALRQGIGNMISGASVAFLTSVWGVTSSVVFNLLEKLMERYVRKRIFRLQNKIDYLYPRINAEQSLVKIVDYNRIATETLQGLAEKIGDRLQEAILHTTDTIRSGLEESLNQIMAPAIQSLVANAHQGSKEALESLLNRFLDGVGEAGQAQRKAMESTAKDVAAAVGGLGTQISSFLTSLEEQAAVAKEESRARHKMVDEELRGREHLQTEHQKELEKKFEIMIAGLVEKLNEHHRQSEDRDHSRSATFEKQLQEMVIKNNEIVELIGGRVISQLEKGKESHDRHVENINNILDNSGKTQGALAERVEALISLQYDESELLRQGMSELMGQFRLVADANSSAGREMVDASKQMNAVTNQLGLMAVTVKQSTDKLANDIEKAAALTADVADKNHEASQNLRDSLEGYRQLTRSMDDVVTKLSGATESAERGFTIVRERLDEFKQSMTNHVSELDGHIQNLLINYAEQVKNQTTERLNVWNEQTNSYISLMTRSIQALNALVDDLESKIGDRK
ncbi:MAG: anti-phage defense ZorAB system ZorA [Deltaproteobacteria bacterium]|nr:anti-phage defense ZorAB system ZorA [Deltaproteobacteria bacterium]